MTKLRGTVAYAGTHYFGWQRTLNGPSIQGELERVFSQILQEAITIEGASRTDRGVHAEGQVLAFTTHKTFDLGLLLKGARSLLPKDIALKELAIVPEVFHPTLDAAGKEYHYLICNGKVQLPFFREFSWHQPLPLNLELMRTASLHLVGTRDFSALSNTAKDKPREPIKQIDRISILELPHQRIAVEVVGGNFLYKMVRNIVGALVDVGKGRMPIKQLVEALELGDRSSAGVCAPAHGLILKKVFYN